MIIMFLIQQEGLNFDQGNHYDETNKKFVAPIAGLYWFHASWDLRDEIVNNVTYYLMSLKLNGDVKFHHIYDHVGTQDSFYHTIVLNGMMDLSVNDEVTAIARQEGGSNQTNIDIWNILYGIFHRLMRK